MQKSGCNRGGGFTVGCAALACSSAALDCSKWEKIGLHFIACSLIFCFLQMSNSLCLIRISDFPKKKKNKVAFQKTEFSEGSFRHCVHTHHSICSSSSSRREQLHFIYLVQHAARQTVHTRQKRKLLQIG